MRPPHEFDIQFVKGAIRLRITDTLEWKGIGKYKWVLYQAYIDRSSAIKIGSRFLKVAEGLVRVVKKNDTTGRK